MINDAQRNSSRMCTEDDEYRFHRSVAEGLASHGTGVYN